MLSYLNSNIKINSDMRYKDIKEGNPFPVISHQDWNPEADFNLDIEIEEFDIDFTKFGLENFDKLMFNPVHVSIAPETFVDLVKDARIIKSGSWEEIIDWINDNWVKLNGKYDVSKQGAVLHSITVSH